MDVQAALARFALDPNLAAGIASALQSQLDQAREQAAHASAEAARLAEEVSRRDTELHAARIKIEALTLELSAAAPPALRGQERGALGRAARAL